MRLLCRGTAGAELCFYCIKRTVLEPSLAAWSTACVYEEEDMLVREAKCGVEQAVRVRWLDKPLCCCRMSTSNIYKPWKQGTRDSKQCATMKTNRRWKKKIYPSLSKLFLSSSSPSSFYASSSVFFLSISPFDLCLFLLPDVSWSLPFIISLILSTLK